MDNPECCLVKFKQCLLDIDKLILTITQPSDKNVPWILKYIVEIYLVYSGFVCQGGRGNNLLYNCLQNFGFVYL